jgi:hypothetical protein
MNCCGSVTTSCLKGLNVYLFNTRKKLFWSLLIGVICLVAIASTNPFLAEKLDRFTVYLIDRTTLVIWPEFHRQAHELGDKYDRNNHP